MGKWKEDEEDEEEDGEIVVRLMGPLAAFVAAIYGV